MCSCTQAVYCSKKCKDGDKYYHKQRCDRDAESSEEEKELVLTDKSRKGIVGLRNLGNTCFMNSGIQCITSIDVLTEYFLQDKYVAHINVDNPIGTKGELSKAYAKQMKKMWYGEQDSLIPTDLKRAIGKFQPMFLGYDQHDSGELIGYLLDGLHEDLNRVKVKPYT
jgi:ubiquitin carboxyl-terminal hydrolase 4/11/15